MTKAVVLYEDQRLGKRFGPHDLLCGLVADELGKPQHTVAGSIKEWPLKGNGTLLKALRDPSRWRSIAKSPAPILAIVDSDKIRNHVGTKRSSDREVEKLIRDTCLEPERLTVILLVRNLESVVDAIARCDSSKVLGADMVVRAGGKDRHARDELLGRLGTAAELRSIRNCVKAKVGALARASKFLVEVLRAR